MAAPESECGGSDGGYRDLGGVRVELDPLTARGGGGGGFAISFWLYLSSSARPSSLILHQVTMGDANKLPFLALGEGNKLLLFPLTSLHREAPAPATSSYPWTGTTNLSSTSECPLEKWFHIGCEASCRRNFILEVVLINAFGEPVKDKEVLCCCFACLR
nr:unnamed protein product [Digitaria exilis]